MARGKECDFAFLTSSGGKFYKFFMTIALAIPPLNVKKNILFAYDLHLKNINGKSQCYKGNISLKVHIQYSPD